MFESMKPILVIIPARGGSKGIPRKNLRSLNGSPLIKYSIITALQSRFQPDVYVSSEDNEILSIAKKIGAKTHERDLQIAKDETTLDPVIFSCFNYAEKKEKKKYELVVTLQPTSPLLKSNTLDNALGKILDNVELDTLISVKDSTHLSWKKINGKYTPNYTKRLNRQYLPKSFQETGGFLITRSKYISNNNRIGNNIDLVVLNDGEEIDIDDYRDWNLCEYLLRQKHILFIVTGNKTVGLGHVYNSLLVANDILNHRLSFLVPNDSNLAYEVIKSNNYPVFIQKNKNIVEDIKRLNPDIVINDILDTQEKYIADLKKNGYVVINFEDLGPGSNTVDLLINAIYPNNINRKNGYYGEDYVLLRDEFIISEEKLITKEIKEVLITFGGVDPNNYTKKVLNSIYDFCQLNKINITVISGKGYTKFSSLKTFPNINLVKEVNNISDYMLRADLIFTSAGRTVYEIASIGTPSIVLEQNERESTHFFASQKYGFENLGLGYEVREENILKSFIQFVNDFQLRRTMSDRMKKNKLRLGRKNVMNLINDLINRK